jgi:hypothetical protein
VCVMNVTVSCFKQVGGYRAQMEFT